MKTIKTMKTKFTVKPPLETGWYWVKYVIDNPLFYRFCDSKKEPKKISVICPAKFFTLGKFSDFFQWSICTAGNDRFSSYGDKSVKEANLKFGPKIEEPK